MKTPLRELVLNEARAYAVFTGGWLRDHGFAVSLVCDQLPDPRFNRAYVLQSEVPTAESMQKLTKDFSSVSLPFRMDVFLPVSKRIEEFLERTMFDVTQNYASEMVLAKTLMLRAIEDSRTVGNSTLCLQTRAESFQEHFYQQLGFEVVARRNRAIQTEP